VGDEVIGAASASGAPGGEKDEACVKAGSVQNLSHIRFGLSGIRH